MENVNQVVQNDLLKKIYFALGRFPAYSDLQVTSDGTELNCLIGGVVKVNMRQAALTVVIRCDAVIEGKDEEQVNEIGYVLEEQLEEQRIQAIKQVDENHLSLMLIVRPDTPDDEEESVDLLTAEKDMFNKILMFCNAISSNSNLFMPEEQQQDNYISEEDAEMQSQYEALFEAVAIDVENETFENPIEEIPSTEENTTDNESELSSQEPEPNYEDIDLDEIMTQLEQQENELKAILESNKQEQKPVKRKRNRHRRRKNKENQNDNASEMADEIADAIEDDEDGIDVEAPIIEPLDPSEAASTLDCGQYPGFIEIQMQMNAEYSERVNKLNARIEERQQKLQTWKNNLDTLSAELIKQQELFDKNVADKRTELNTLYQEQISALDEKKKADLKEVENEKIKNFAELKEKNNELILIQQQIDYQTQQLEANRVDLEHMRAELEEDRRQFERQKQLEMSSPEFVHARIKELQEKNDELERILSESGSMNDALEEAHNKITKLEEQMKAMVPADVASINPAEVLSMRGEIDTLHNEKDKLLNMAKLQKQAIIALKAEKIKAENEAKIALEQRISEQNDDNQPTVNSEMFTVKIEELNQQIEELSDRNEVLSDNLDEKIRECDKIKKQYDDAVAELEEEKANALESLQDDTPAPNKPRYDVKQIQSIMTGLGIETDIKPGHDQIFVVGEKDGCFINVNYEKDFVYIEKRCKNTRKHMNEIAEWNQNGGITFNYWYDAEKIMCRVDYTLRPNDSYIASTELAELIAEVCQNLEGLR